MQNQQTRTYAPTNQTHAAAASAAAGAAASHAPPARAASAASSSLAATALVEVEVARSDASQGGLSRSRLESKLREWLLIQSRLMSGEMVPPPVLRSCLLTIRCEVIGAAGADGDWHTSPDGVSPKEADLQFYIYVLAEDDEEGESRRMEMQLAAARSPHAQLTDCIAHLPRLSTCSHPLVRLQTRSWI